MISQSVINEGATQIIENILTEKSKDDGKEEVEENREIDRVAESEIEMDENLSWKRKYEESQKENEKLKKFLKISKGSVRKLKRKVESLEKQIAKEN